MNCEKKVSLSLIWRIQFVLADQSLGTFAEMQKLILVSSSLSVPPAWNDLAATGLIFFAFDIWVSFEKNHRENSIFIKIWQH